MKLLKVGKYQILLLIFNGGDYISTITWNVLAYISIKFSLEFFLELMQVFSFKIQFQTQVLANKLPEVLDFSKELANLEPVAKVLNLS
ncbi:hypothetical protein S245_020747 [Arachis hypogaea]